MTSSNRRRRTKAAWIFPGTLSKSNALPVEDQPGKIKELDQKVANIHNVILRPGFVLRFVLALVRLGELRSVKRIISILE